MPTQQTLLAFVLVSAGLTLIPGPSTFFLLSHGIGHGRRSALAAMTGIETAAAIRVLAAAAGLSALLTSSPSAAVAVRWAGVAYLAFLGARALRPGPSAQEPGSPAARAPLARSARKGLVFGLGNVNMVIFFVAFFPPFIHPARGSQALQMLVLGAVFWLFGTLCDLAVACASGRIGAWLQNRPRLRASQPRLEGAAYLTLAAWAALSIG